MSEAATCEPAIFEVLRELRRELTACQVRVTEALNILATLNIPDEARVTCPRCGVALRGPATLAEHLYVSHDGPVPATWERADRLAG